MNATETREQRFDQYIDRLGHALGHADRVGPLRSYCTGLLLPGERKSVEPMAARLEPGQVQRCHQSLHHFVATAAWDDEAVLAVARGEGLAALARHGGITGWLVDDSGAPKKGRHSVGVARQYCGQVGKVENCQVAVSLSVANASLSVPLAFRLYLPESWAADPARREPAGVPAEVEFATKPQLSVQQIEAARAAGVTPAPVIADAGYGFEAAYRTRLTELGLQYAVGIQSTTTVLTLSGEAGTVKALALALSPSTYRAVTWRAGTNRPLRSRFAALRVVAAHPAGAAEWLLIEWPVGEPEPTRYWLSTLPARTSLKKLVATVKLRWGIERDYEELKQELGLNHYEGRGWRGFHHHATLCIAAYTFLMAERSRFSPSGANSRLRLRAPTLPPGFRPRGAPAAARAA